MKPVPVKARNANVAKYLSYREAWTRIKQACAAGFFFEAVTLEESIMSDRLLSYVLGVEPNARLSTRSSFSQLIKRWRKAAGPSLTGKGGEDLGRAVDEWRERRNVVIHGLVKSDPGKPTPDVADFVTEAEGTAELGRRLAIKVQDWHRQQLRNTRRKHAV